MYSVGTGRDIVSVLNVLGSSKYEQCLLIDKIDSFFASISATPSPSPGHVEVAEQQHDSSNNDL